jgi:starvation-inducible outer membrane lipoprotein
MLETGCLGSSMTTFYILWPVEQSAYPPILKKGGKITVGGEIVGERIEDTETVKFKYPVLYIKQFYLWDREKNKWWEPRSSSGWFWELFGTSSQSLPEDWEQGGRKYEVW